MLENYYNVDDTWTTPKTVLWPRAYIHVCVHEAAHTCTDSERKDRERDVRKQKSDRPKQNTTNNNKQKYKTESNNKQKTHGPPFWRSLKACPQGFTHLHSLCGRSQRQVRPSVHAKQLWWWPCKTELAQDLTQTCPSHRKTGFSVVRPLSPQRCHNPQMGRARSEWPRSPQRCWHRRGCWQQLGLSKENKRNHQDEPFTKDGWFCVPSSQRASPLSSAPDSNTSSSLVPKRLKSSQTTNTHNALDSVLLNV